jgi:hypothetical protein
MVLAILKIFPLVVSSPHPRAISLYVAENDRFILLVKTIPSSFLPRPKIFVL